MNRFQRSKHAVYNINYHIIWTPKYRKSLLTGSFKKIIESSLFKKASELKIEIKEYELMPDHIHLFIKCKPTDKVSDVVKNLKGFSSYMLRKKFPKYKMYKSFWSSSYYCESIGHISEKTIIKYINDQTKK